MLLSQLLWVPPTNFGGLDEWLDLELTGRGIVSVPYAYRPLGLIWPVPASLLGPAYGFAAFRLLYAIYALLTAALVFGIARRLLPMRPLLAMLTACFAIAWAPRDMARLSTVEGAVYQGITLGAVAAVALLMEAWRRQSLPLFGASVLMAFLSIRCYEGVAPVLAGAPVLLLLTQMRSRRLWRWTFVWWSVVGIALAFYLLEMSVSLRQNAYQLAVLGLHPDPAGWLARMARQYAFHLLPLVASAPRELLAPAVPLAVVVFVLALVGSRPDHEPVGRRLLAATTVVGLAFAGLGYSLVLLGVTVPTAFRLQFISGPGIATFLAALVQLAASLLPGRIRFAAVALLGSWVVAIGTGRTVAMQSEWDALTFQPRQLRMLSELVRAVPDVLPHTLVVVVDDGRAWRAAFSFHHAVQYLYERRAAGFVPGRQDTLYTAVPDADGVRFEPWAIVRRAWDAPRRLFRYDELVVVRHTPTGQVDVLDTWPKELAPLPEGARYAPRSRITPGALEHAAILTRQW